MAMSIALHHVIPLMELIKEIREHKFNIVNTQPYVYCKVFEDNSGALELSTSSYVTITSGNMCGKP